MLVAGADAEYLHRVLALAPACRAAVGHKYAGCVELKRIDGRMFQQNGRFPFFPQNRCPATGALHIEQFRIVAARAQLCGNGGQGDSARCNDASVRAKGTAALPEAAGFSCRRMA